MNEEIQRLLESCPEKIRDSIEKVHFSPGEFLLRQGDNPTYVYILLEGRAKNYLETSNGISYLMDTSLGNDLTGEIEVFNDYSVICNVQAFTDCETLRIAKGDFLRWIEESREFSFFCFRQITDKIRDSNLMTATNIAYPLRYRVESILWSMTTAGKKYIEKDDVVIGLGAKLRSVNRILRDLIDGGFLEYDEGIIKVVSADRLAEDMKGQENRFIANKSNKE